MKASERMLPQRQVVARPRLLRLLGSGFKVGLISAPAGCGKSVLAAQFAQGQQALWCRVHAEDSEPFRILARLLPAARALSPGFGGLTLRYFDKRRDAERDEALITATFLEELEARRRPLLIVLDDLHHLSPAAPAIRWLKRVVEESGPNVRFLITCRGECPLPLSRPALLGGIVRIGEAELAFTGAEQRLLFQKLLGSAPSRQADPLIRSLRGWAAGLVLAARSLGAGAGGSAGSRAGRKGDSSRADVMEFFAQEVYAPLPGRIKRGLKAASLLEDLEEPLLRVLLGAGDARRLLDEIRRRDLLLGTLPDGGAPARFHPLFRDFLKQRLREDGGLDEWRRLHVRLARHWLAGEETSRAARVLAEADVPEDAVGERTPWLALHSASEALAEGRPQDAAVLARRAGDAFLAQRSHELLVRAYRIESVSASLAGNLEAARRRGLDLWRRIPARQVVTRARLARNIGFVCLHGGRPRAAETWLARSLRGLRGAGLALDRAQTRLMQAAVDFTEGRWEIYLREARAALPALRAAGYEGRVRAVHLNMAEACIYRGEEDRALEHLHEAGILLARNPSLSDAAMAAVQKARVCSETGRLREAAVEFAAARTEVRKSGSRQRELEWEVWAGVLDRRAGRLAGAQQKLTRAEDGFRRAHSVFWVNVACMELALVRGLRGEHEAALRNLDQCAQVSKQLGDRKEMARCRLFAARIIQHSGRDASSALRSAVRLLEAEDYLILLRKEADVAAPLLGSVAAGGADWYARSVSMLPAARVTRCRKAAPGRGSAPVRTRSQVLRLQLMGSFEARVDGRQAALPRRASQAILAMLALRPGVPVRWEALAERLWPGTGAAASRNRLDVALRGIRASLEPDVPPRGAFQFLITDSGLCHLESGCLETDVAEFERRSQACEGAVRRAALRPWQGAAADSLQVLRADLKEVEGALAAYRGDLLEGSDSSGWLEDERTRLRARRDRVLLSQGRLLLALRRFPGAVESAREALRAEPLRDEAQQLLMRSLAACGRRPEALKSYGDYCARLRQELGAEPDPEIAALAAELSVPIAAPGPTR